MLDELIAGWVEAGTRSHDRVVALRLQRIARVVVIPASLLMVAGLVMYAVAGLPAGAQAGALPLTAFFSRAVLSPLGALSAGLLALALLPIVNVLYILGDRIATKRWLDVGAAALVAAILILGMILGRK